MRTFFRSHVGNIGRLLNKVADIAIAYAKTSSSNVQEFLPEANRTIVVGCFVHRWIWYFSSFQTVLRSAFQYRAYNLGVYGVEPPMIKAWTSRPMIIDAVLSLFDLTTKTVESSARTRDREPSSQLPALAAVLFKSIKERLDWLSRQVFPQTTSSFPFLFNGPVVG